MPYGMTPVYSGDPPVREADDKYVYLFEKWTPAISAVSGDATYVAVFTPQAREYGVAYETDGGTIHSGGVDSYTYGTAVPLPNDVTKDGFVFGGWYASSDLTGDAVSEITAQDTGDKTFYAMWISSDATVGGVTVNGAPGVLSGTQITVALPAGSSLPADADAIVITTANATASVSTPQSDDGGATWTFTVTAADGKTSQTYTIAFAILPEVTVEPKELTVEEGANATFAAKASGYPAPTYQWQLDNGVARSWQDIEGETGDTLTIPAATMAMNGYAYRCVATNSAGAAVSNSAVLTVEAKKPPVEEQKLPEIHSAMDAQSVEAVAGETVKLTVTASNADAVQWFVDMNDGKGFVPCANGSAATLIISPVTEAHDGAKYFCRVTNEAGSVDSPVFTLSVEKAVALPQTGDDSHLLLWMMLCFAGMAGLVIARRRQRG